ncbi:hypothetical protein GCM10027591_08740 [Zhihengliuella somnathii]
MMREPMSAVAARPVRETKTVVKVSRSSVARVPASGSPLMMTEPSMRAAVTRYGPMVRFSDWGWRLSPVVNSAA